MRSSSAAGLRARCFAFVLAVASSSQVFAQTKEPTNPVEPVQPVAPVVPPGTAVPTPPPGTPRAPITTNPPGSTPQIGPLAEPPAVAPPPEEAPAPASEAAGPVGPDGTPLDVPFELQSLRDDQQGLQTDLENFKFQWQRERDLHTAITTRPLVINGVIQVRYLWTDQAVRDTIVYNRKGTFDIGAALLAFNGNLYKDYEEGRNLTYSLRFGTSPQQSGNTAFLNLLDANITYSLLPTIDREAPQLTVTAGQQLLPFGLEVPANEELKPVIRNAEFTNRLQLARREVGLIIRGDLFPAVDYGYNYRQALIAYAVGVVNGSGPNFADENDHKDLIARLAFTVPSEYHSWLRQITIGGTIYYGWKNTYVVDGATRTLAGKGERNRYGLDVYYNHWPFGLTYEFIVGEDVATPGKTLAASGRTTVESRSHVGTFFLSFGEQFVSGFRNQGRYDDWWPKTWQPFVRVDLFDPNVDVEDNNTNIYTGGLNIFFAETTKFQLNYNYRDDDLNPKGAANEIFAQVQFGF